MKKLLLFALIILPVITKAQNFQSLPEVNGKVVYESIVTFDNTTVDVLFNAANKWMLTGDADTKKIVLSADQQQAQILGKGTMMYDNVKYTFNIQIDCKDNKYRIRLTDIFYSTKYALPSALENYNADLKSTTNLKERLKGWNMNDKFKDILSSLESSIKTPVKDDF